MNIDDLEASSIPLTAEQRIARAIEKLPTLTPDRVPLEDSCPICLLPFPSILDGSAQNEGMLHGVAPKPIALSGVTRLEGCGHIFCRVDLIEWIRGRHGTCPACRHTFLDIKPLSDSDNESSDGDYIPGDEDEEDEEDGFLEEFSDDEEYEDDFDNVPFDSPQLARFGTGELPEDWETDEETDETENMGLSDDVESENLSEGELIASGEEDLQGNDDAQVHADEGADMLSGSSAHTAGTK